MTGSFEEKVQLPEQYEKWLKEDVTYIITPAEKETLEDIAQVFGITVYVRTHKGGKLIALGNG